MDKKILNVFAHGDDCSLACGGTLHRLIHRQNCIAKTIILGEPFMRARNNSDFTENITWIINADNQTIGVKKVSIHGFDDNRFDSVPLLDIVKVIEKEIEKFNPSFIFTHSDKDLNIDHRVTHEAVKTATRPFISQVKGIYCGEVLSSTSCGLKGFNPNVYIKLNLEDIDKKQEALSCYDTEIRSDDLNHPLSFKGIMNLAITRGLECGNNYAEAFELMRYIV